jgi:hypothetical protein
MIVEDVCESASYNSPVKNGQTKPFSSFDRFFFFPADDFEVAPVDVTQFLFYRAEGSAP